MTKAFDEVKYIFSKMFEYPPKSVKDFTLRFKHCPRVGYCVACGSWGWNTIEIPAYQSERWAPLC